MFIIQTQKFFWDFTIVTVFARHLRHQHLAGRGSSFSIRLWPAWSSRASSWTGSQATEKPCLEIYIYIHNTHTYKLFCRETKERIEGKYESRNGIHVQRYYNEIQYLFLKSSILYTNLKSNFQNLLLPSLGPILIDKTISQVQFPISKLSL